MRYTKPHLSFGEQADLIISRGLIANKKELIEKLQAVSYYRLSGYWYPFRNSEEDTFKPDTSLDKVWRRYTFDRQLRLLVLDAIERVEIAIRTSLVYYHSAEFGAFGYLDGENLPNLKKNEFMLLQGKFNEAAKRSKAAFVEHFFHKYGDTHRSLPLWMLAEVMPFGAMFTFFRGADKSIKKHIANEYELRFGVLESWLFSLNMTRNICAHHERLWNRILGVKPLIPAKDPRWHSPVEVKNSRIFGLLTLLKYMLNYTAPQSRWQGRLESLFEKYEDVPKLEMGFPENWKKCPVWQQK